MGGGGGVPISHNALQHFPECRGGGVPWSDQPGGVPCQVQSGGWVPCQVQPGGGGTQVGQQKEYSIHGGRYASCVHTGGLSCLAISFYMSVNVFITQQVLGEDLFTVNVIPTCDVL